MSNIITINRQFGSGGSEVGELLAKELNYAYYDKNLIHAIANESGFAEEYIESYNETATRDYYYTFSHTFSTFQQSPTDKIQLAFLKVIKELAQKDENMVIIGRCASHILNDYKPFKVFIYASDMDFRVARRSEDGAGKSKEEGQKMIQEMDKKRAKYHEFYTGQVWNDMSNYNLCIDTSIIGIEKAVELVKLALKNK